MLKVLYMNCTSVIAIREYLRAFDYVINPDAPNGATLLGFNVR
jgi:hypothetical protein